MQVTLQAFGWQLVLTRRETPPREKAVRPREAAPRRGSSPRRAEAVERVLDEMRDCAMRSGKMF